MPPWPASDSSGVAAKNPGHWIPTPNLENHDMIQITTLARLPLSYKVLFTGFLLVMGLGLLMAGFQIMQTHGKADGKPGLSINDIV